MDAKTLEALKGSIKKWEKIVAGTGADLGSQNCPLCEKFIYNNCAGCPVREATTRRMCLGSPYHDFTVFAKFNGVDGSVADSPEAKAAAQAELDFLRSVLPEGH